MARDYPIPGRREDSLPAVARSSGTGWADTRVRASGAWCDDCDAWPCACSVDQLDDDDWTDYGGPGGRWATRDWGE